MKDSYILYTHKLEGEYADTFKQIEYYCSNIVMDEATREEHLSELLDMFLNAQKSGKSVKKIVGSDVTWFCREFCSDIDYKSRIKAFVDKFKSLIWGIFILSGLDFITIVIDMLNGVDVSLFSNESSDICKYAVGFVVLEVFMFLFNFVVISIIHRFNKIPTKPQRICCSIVALIIGIAGYALAMGFIPDITIPTFILFALSGVYLAVYYIINKKKDEFKASVFDVDDESQTSINEMLIKEYHKKNQKLIKKGKAPQTPEEYIEKQRKMIKSTKLSNLAYLSYPLIIVIACLLTEFESIPDMIFFILLLAVVEFLVFLFFYKSEKQFIVNVKNFIKLWEKDSTILDETEEEY